MAFFERFQLHALFRLLLLTVIAASNPKFIMCGQKNYIYCWWAVDIIDVSKNPILYQNGKSVMIENNIKKLCSETKEGRYGISYVDIKILSNNESIDSLSEVSYYCCNNCTTYKGYSDNRKIEDLLDNYYKRQLEPLHDSDRYCFNINGDKKKNIIDDEPCILIFNVNSEMKIYSGPMLWNQIDIFVSYPSHDFETLVTLFRNGKVCDFNGTSGIGDGECLKLVSQQAYFIICCCWSNPFDCTYDPKQKNLIKKNKKIWLEIAKSSNPAITLHTQTITISQKDIIWSYHDFIYSLPSKESNGTNIIPGLNEPHYYCSQLLSYTESEDIINSSIRWTKLQIKDLPLRYRFCKLSFAILFQNNVAKRIQYKVGPDFEKKCKITRCKHNYPECLADTLRAKTVLIKSSCCCASNLCSTWLEYRDYEALTIKSKYFTTLFNSCYQQLTTYLQASLFGTNKCVRNVDFRLQEEIPMDERNLIFHKLAENTVLLGDRRNLSCAIYHIHTLKDPYCHLRRNYESERTIFQYRSCKCNWKTKTLESNQCDAGITSEMLLKTKDRNRPTCFFTSFTGHEPLFISGQEITLKEGFKQETEEMPICATSLLIGNYGVFYRFYKLRYSRFKDEIASRKRFIVTKKENYTTYTTLCRSNETNPCNNLMDLIRYQLRYSVYYHSKTKKPQPYHQCVIAKKTETIVEKCWSTAGCFIFRYLSSTEKLVGCADKIPSLIEASPSLSPLMWCVEKIYQKEKYRCRAFKGTTNLIISGTLCCCYKDCFIMMDEDEYGFNPFEGVLTS